MSASRIETPDAMTASQLAKHTGVPVRRIRFYVSEGLLAPPSGRGRASYYTAAHLERLQQIIALREVNLGLEEIRARLGSPVEPVPEQEMRSHEPANWFRWEIVPGVELHARDDLDDQTLATVRVMVGAVQHVLEQGDAAVDDWSDEIE
jgi:DNA-binding transcriptional MerR regulator